MGRIERYMKAIKVIFRNHDFVCFRTRCTNETIRCVKTGINPINLDIYALASCKSLEVVFLNEVELNSTEFKNFTKNISVIPSGILADFRGGGSDLKGNEDCLSVEEIAKLINEGCSKLEIRAFEERFLDERNSEINGIGNNWRPWLRFEEFDKRALCNIGMNTVVGGHPGTGFQDWRNSESWNRVAGFKNFGESWEIVPVFGDISNP